MKSKKYFIGNTKKFAAALGAAVMLVCGMPAVTASAEEANGENVVAFSLDSYAAESDCIIYAKYAGKLRGRYKFEIIRMLKGSVPDRYVYVTSSEEFGNGLIQDTNYVLFLDRSVSVYYSADKYFTVEEIKFSADEKGNITGMTVGGIEAENLPETVSILNSYLDAIPSTASPDPDYIRSNSIRDVIDGSPVIARVEVGTRTRSYGDNGSVYECALVETEKGTLPENFSAALFDRKTESGSEYYLLFAGKDSNGIYVLSSKYSMVNTDNESFLEALEEE